MPNVVVLFELIALIAAIAAVLSAIGLGPVALLAPDLGGMELLLAPFFGLAILYWVCQWLSPWFASSWIVLGTCVVGGLLSCLVVFTGNRRCFHRLAAIRTDLLIVVAIGFTVAIALQLPMLHRGVFTLANFSGDDIFTWTPTADYMRHHAYSAGSPLAYTSPLLWVLPTNIYPGSAGTVDGGLAAILRLHTYQFVEPFTAVCLSLGVVGVYILTKMGLNLPRVAAIIAVVLAASNQSRFVIAGFGFAQAARGTVLMMGALILVIVMVRKRSIGAAALLGAVAAVLPAVYMPLFLVVAAAIVGGLVTVIATTVARRASSFPWKPWLTLAASGLVIGAKNLDWLLRGGGLHAWSLQTSYGKAVFFVKYPFKYLVWLAPIDYLYRAAKILPFTLTRPLLWDGAWGAAATGLAVVLLLLVITGVFSMVNRQLLAEVVCLLAPCVYGVVVFVINQGGFGGFQTAAYLSPIVCVLVGSGIWGLAQLPARRADRPRPAHGTEREGARRKRIRYLAPAVILLAMVAVQVAATAETEAFFVEQQGTLPETSLKMTTIASVIPNGATVLMYSADGSNGATTVRKTDVLTAAAMFLPDRNITIEGRYFFGAYEPGDSATIEGMLGLKYDYVLQYVDPTIRQPAIPTGYRVVWRFRPYDLLLYQRV